MSTDAIYDAFASQVGLFATAQGVPVSYPAIPFTQPGDGAWLELQWIPNETQNYGISDNGPSLLQGIAQLGACDRPGRGLGPAHRLADQIVAAFGKGFTFAGARVYRKPWVKSAITDPDRVMLPVLIMWRGFDG